MCVSISASVALACLFVPKVYIVLFQPHKNVRQGAHGSMGSGAPGRPFFGRPSTRFSSLAAMNGDITSPSNDVVYRESLLIATLMMLTMVMNLIMMKMMMMMMMLMTKIKIIIIIIIYIFKQILYSMRHLKVLY